MFTDSYTMVWTLREGGDTWEEEFEDISLSDFEVIYGMNSHEIIHIKLELNGRVEMEELEE